MNESALAGIYFLVMLLACGLTWLIVRYASIRHKDRWWGETKRRELALWQGIKRKRYRDIQGDYRANRRVS